MARQLTRGLLGNIAIYPNLPVKSGAIRSLLNHYLISRSNMSTTKAAVETPIAVKEAALQDLIRAVKSDIRYAENAVSYNDDKLKLIGWAGKSHGQTLVSPSQTRLLEALK